MAANVLPPRNSVRIQTLVAATPQAVWSAFTDPTHLVRWFPLQASLVPEVGGTLTLAWGDIVSAWTITAWQPLLQLEVEQVQAFGSKTGDKAGKTDSSAGWRVLIEAISSLQTMVTLEHFGLGDLPEMLSMVERGWEFEMFSLRYYLERQLGRDRSTIWVRENLDCEIGCESEIWEALVGGRAALPGDLGAEHVEIAECPWQFAATLAYPSSSLFRVKVERVNQGEIELNLWLAAYEASPVGLRRIQADFEQRITLLKKATNEPGKLTCRGAR